MPAEIYLRFYEELNEYLKPEKRKREFTFSFEGPASVWQVLKTLRIPDSEIEIVLVNGLSSDFSHSLEPGDRVSFYPVFESFDVGPVLRIRKKPLRKTRFLVEPKLRRLALYLRLLGFEAVLDPGVCAAETNRQIVLTTNSALLNSGLPRVYVVREREPVKQLEEVLSRLQCFPSNFDRILR